MMRSLLTFISIFIFMAVSAQAPKEKWGNVTMEELSMTGCNIDPAASAAILDNYGHYYFSRYYYFSVQELRTFYHYQVRLKVFTDEGKKYATITIPYRGFDEYEDVTEISGYTYNLVNGKTVKTKMKQKNIRWEKNGRDLWYCTFTLPDVKPGSVIEYSFKIASLDFARLRNWMFQEKIPVLNSDMVLTAPNFYQYAFFSNMPRGKLDFEKKDNYLYLPFYTTNIYCNATELHLKSHNIPAFKKEVWMSDSSQAIFKGEFLLASAITRPAEFMHLNDYYLMPYIKPLLLTTTEEYYGPMERIRLYNEMIVSYKMIEGMDWPGLVKSLGKRDDFGKNMLKAFESKWLIDSFRKVPAGRQRMVAVYDYVRKTMKWNGEYRIFASNSTEKIFEKKAGYSSDINFQLINLLTRSGIPARPVLISTRSNGPVYKELGFLRKFNHVIVAVELDGTRYLLDATGPARPYDLLSIEDLNGEGLLINLLDYQWIPLISHSVSEVHQSEDYHISPDGSYHSEDTASYTGYCKFEELKMEDSTLNRSVKENAKEPLILKKSNNGQIKATSSSLYFAPLSENSPVENPFSTEERTYPVDLKFERVITREISLTVPEGYTLTSYPAARNLMMENYLFCSLQTLVENKTLKLQFRFEVKNSLIPTYFYPDLKLFLETVKKLEQEQVVFTKG